MITGITGQDGSYLAEFLLEKGYIVHGIKRRASSFNTQRVDHIYQDPHIDNANFKLHYGDLTDTSNLVRIVQETQPDEIYNLGAQSHVAVSFESPEYTADVDGMGTLRILEASRRPMSNCRPVSDNTAKPRWRAAAAVVIKLSVTMGASQSPAVPWRVTWPSTPCSWPLTNTRL